MAGLRLLTAAEQVAAHLREELISGKLSGTMPGVLRLESRLGVNRNTLEAGLKLLEEEGLLVPQGTGRRRRISIPADMKQPSLRIAILVGEAADRRLDYMVELQHELSDAGHSSFHTTHSMDVLKMDVKRIARMVRETEADAWVVMAGSLGVLQWFCKEELPVFAIFGRRRGLPIAGAGPDTTPAFAAATRELIGLGHRRIVLLTRALRRIPAPVPGSPENAFLAELKAHGIPSGDYNLPDWEETVAGLHARLESLFKTSPPTALITDEAPFFLAALQFLSGRRLMVPEDVSLMCTDASPEFRWCQPPVSHISWDTRPLVSQVVRWAKNVGRGKKDIRQTNTPAIFLRGGTIGPARG
ncbi:LacI family DNA-binding transcriptional regulator [Akkermansiaceae bacterium]|nr:LacI family DNA-binding transcriptional regulator [Akkermansiaceae bacterium]